MTIAPLEPDGQVTPVSGGPASNPQALFADLVVRASSALERAADAEQAFVHGRGGLQEMVIERAQADVLLQLAAAVTSRCAGSLSTILSMQV